MMCPGCRGDLQAVRSSGVQTYACDGCCGRALTVPILRRFAPKGAIDRLWRIAWERCSKTLRKCPVCTQRLVAFEVDLPDKPIEMNACRQCQLFFYDGAQLGPVPADLAQPTGTLSPRARSAYDRSRMKALDEHLETAQAKYGGELDPDVAWWARPVLQFFI